MPPVLPTILKPVARTFRCPECGAAGGFIGTFTLTALHRQQELFAAAHRACQPAGPAPNPKGQP